MRQKTEREMEEGRDRRNNKQKKHKNYRGCYRSYKTQTIAIKRSERRDNET